MKAEEKELLAARISDYAAKAEKGSVATSRFLTPGEQKTAEKILCEMGISNQSVFFGGYPDTERKMLFIIPEFYTALPNLMPRVGEDPAARLDDPNADAVDSVCIRGSGFRQLSHRDYLGSLLGLGLERDAIGDIALQSKFDAVVFCRKDLIPFLIENVNQVSSDKVKCTRYILDENFTDGRVFQPINDTIASPRLDCVVAALTNLSREAAQTFVRSGCVEVDFEETDRCDRMLTPPAVLSLRGYGRFYLRSFDGETKKGRLRMRADKLI